MNWIALSFVAMLCFLFMNYLFKIASPKAMLPVLFFLYASAALVLIPFLKPIGRKGIILGLVAGLLSLAGTIASFIAIQKAPNPGFVLAIIATNSLGLALLSYFLLGSRLGLDDIIGIILVIIGLSLIVI